MLSVRADDLSGAGDVDDGGRSLHAVPPGLRRACGLGPAGAAREASGVEIFHEETDEEGKKTC